MHLLMLVKFSIISKVSFMCVCLFVLHFYVKHRWFWLEDLTTFVDSCLWESLYDLDMNDFTWGVILDLLGFFEIYE